MTDPTAKSRARAKPSTQAKAASPWRREASGTHRSSDDRFSIVSEGSGRWFLRDDHEPDELGQPRTLGPYATLAQARSAAEERRQRGPEESPLAARLAGSRRRSATGRATGTRAPKAAKPPGKAPPTWLERLGAKDPAAGRRARALIGALERIGVPQAEAVVRRDVESLRPAVVEAVLAVAIRREIARVNDPARLLEAVLQVVSMNERLTDDAHLPGWRLVEAGERGRRLHVTAAGIVGEDHPTGR